MSIRQSVCLIVIGVLTFVTLGFCSAKAVETKHAIGPNALYRIDGRFLRAYIVAYSDFRSLPEVKSHVDWEDVRNYVVSFDEDDQSIYVYFVPKRVARERGL